VLHLDEPHLWSIAATPPTLIEDNESASNDLCAVSEQLIVTNQCGPGPTDLSVKGGFLASAVAAFRRDAGHCSRENDESRGSNDFEPGRTERNDGDNAPEGANFTVADGRPVTLGR
jgi:hypothetical protein